MDYRIPPPLGSQLLFCHPPPSHLARGGRRRRRARFHPMVGTRPPRAPPLHGHREGSVLHQQGPSLFAPWVDGDEAESQTPWTHRHLRLKCRSGGGVAAPELHQSRAHHECSCAHVGCGSRMG